MAKGSSSKDLTNRDVVLSLTSVLTHPGMPKHLHVERSRAAGLCCHESRARRREVRALQDVARFLRRDLHAGNPRKACAYRLSGYDLEERGVGKSWMFHAL